MQVVRDRLRRNETHCWNCDTPNQSDDLVNLCSPACEVEWRRKHPPMPTLHAKQCACGLIYIPSMGEKPCHRLVAT
jgi:hypothetical protein